LSSEILAIPPSSSSYFMIFLFPRLYFEFFIWYEYYLLFSQKGALVREKKSCGPVLFVDSLC
jgi:hypothetical protein